MAEEARVDEDIGVIRFAMSKYEPLADYLRHHPASEIVMSFADIERLTGVPLPPKAQAQRVWWDNDPSTSAVTRVWLAAGFRMESVDLAARRLVFRRADERRPEPDDASIPLVNGHHPAFGALAGLLIVAPGVDLTEPACPEWSDIAEGHTI